MISSTETPEKILYLKLLLVTEALVYGWVSGSLLRKDLSRQEKLGFSVFHVKNGGNSTSDITEGTKTNFTA